MYITVLTNESYLLGCCVLKKSLDNVSAKFPLYVLCPKDINDEITFKLENRGIKVLFTDTLSPEILNRDNKVEYWNDTLYKLKIFDLCQFETVVFLDSDMIILNNIDHLFLKPHMSAVSAGHVLHPNWIRLNSGLMVIKPDHKEYLGLISCIDLVYKERMEKNEGFGDQDVINAYFFNWQRDASLHLDEVYNVMLGYAGYLHRAEMIDSFENIMVYHFTGRQKPWSKKFSVIIAILLKIIKRSKSFMDFKAFLCYRRYLKMIK